MPHVKLLKIQSYACLLQLHTSLPLYIDHRCIPRDTMMPLIGDIRSV